MAEHWIPARKALEIAESSHALCARLHAGLVKAKAALFQTKGDKKFDELIPPAFWWAEGHEALEQDWEAGDFSTWIDKRYQLQAFGVSFALSGLLDMVPVERAPLISRSLSVAGNPDWLSAKEARIVVYQSAQIKHAAGIGLILAQAKLGFVAARAVQAVGYGRVREVGSGWDWEEREWDIPVWFWQEFAKSDHLHNWDLGKLSGEGRSPIGLHRMELHGVHFHRASIEAVNPVPEQPEPIAPTSRGRRPKYDWSAATSAIWGQLYRAAIIPDTQADIERALIKFLAKGDDEPSESTVRPYAKVIWEEFQVP